MCLPIFPNETHPTGRPALHTEPVFPFPGCYHWAFADTGVRVLPKADGWKPREAVLLPPIQRVKMNQIWNVDFAEADSAAANNNRLATDIPMHDDKSMLFMVFDLNGLLISRCCWLYRRNPR